MSVYILLDYISRCKLDSVKPTKQGLYNYKSKFWR